MRPAFRDTVIAENIVHFTRVLRSNSGHGRCSIEMQDAKDAKSAKDAKERKGTQRNAKEKGVTGSGLQKCINEVFLPAAG